MKEHKINKLDNFIQGWYLEDTSICDRLIDFYKNSENKYDGVTGGGVEKDKKDSIDANLSHDSAVDYFKYLQPVLNQYIEKYNFCNYYSPFSVIEAVSVQYYKPKAGYHAWHTERSNTTSRATSRHLVFMTYLNDVTDKGETEFYHQKIKVKPEKGLTLIWPVDWPFTHRGVPSPTQEKYITTGWFNFTR
jgi:hypothetical protein